ncbi:MAG: ABC transporter permease [Dehalococcoidales bacterium]|nr:ABC transporter permease [Dehalococcoidales bacterium]
MNKTLLLIKHELAITVRRKAFIILTLAFPLVALLGILTAQVIPGTVTPSTKVEKVGYVDEIGIFTDSLTKNNIELVPFVNEDAAKSALINNDIKEYFVITPDYMMTALIQRYTLKSEIEPSGTIKAVISEFLLNNLLKGNSADIIDRVQSPMNIASITLTSTGEIAPRQGGFTALILPYVFSILLMISIFFSSGYLLQGLVEEKENRVMEILLSSVSSGQLLLGKIIGLGAVGLVQIIIWLISANFLLRMASSSFGNVIGALQVTPDFWILGIIYFVLGYLLVAIINSVIGAVTSTARESQQLTPLIVIPIMIPLYFMGLIMAYPDSVVVKILTFIPLTAPITVIARLGLSEIPVWELAVSILILVLTIIGCFILATKLFRTYLLMYGKRPDMKEIIRSFKNA